MSPGLRSLKRALNLLATSASNGAKDRGGISMNLKHKSIGIVAGLGCLMASSVALAQEAQGNVGMSLPGAAPAAAAAAGSSDHDQVVGRLALGYLGRRSMGVGASGTGGGAVANPEAPIIGIRYWIDQMLGIDAGVGLLIAGGSWEDDDGTTTTDGDLPSFTVFMLHGGVPLSLASADHFSFQIVPEVNVGIGSGTDGDGDIKHNGFQLDLGARAGAEIQFGFMGIPQLSLQGSIGALFALQSLKTDVDVGPTTVTATQNATVLTTTVGDNPWNIFTSNVAALYYF
jgi:hypothetical protein